LGPEGEGQEPVPAGELELPLTLKKLGYTIGGFGKWGLGAVGTTGDPNKQGFDLFFGYNCQSVAHNYYPTRLWSNDTRMALNNPSFSPRQRRRHHRPIRDAQPSRDRDAAEEHGGRVSSLAGAAR